MARKEVIDVKLPYPSVEFTNVMKHIHSSGFNELSLSRITNEKGEVIENELIRKEVEGLLQKPKQDKEENPEVQLLRDEIAELRAEISSKAKKETKEEEIDPELNDARASYKAAFNKKPHHSWSASQINEKIKEFQS